MHCIPSVRATPMFFPCIKRKEAPVFVVFFSPRVFLTSSGCAHCAEEARCDESAAEIAETTRLGGAVALTLHGCDRLVSLDGDL
jgi:hypothetical protein